MKDIILVGSGGCMRELVWQIQELNKENKTWYILGYVDREPPKAGTEVKVGNQRIEYLGDDDFLLQRTMDTNVAVCVGAPALREKIVNKLKVNPKIHFPNVILGNTQICPDVSMGEGCIISMDCRISTNVRLGDFVFLNIGSMICHDGVVGDYVTLSPDVKIAGGVHIESGCNIGLGTKVIQGIRIGENVITGAGSVVVKNIESSCTVVGVPAVKIK